MKIHHLWLLIKRILQTILTLQECIRDIQALLVKDTIVCNLWKCNLYNAYPVIQLMKLIYLLSRGKKPLKHFFWSLSYGQPPYGQDELNSISNHSLVRYRVYNEHHFLTLKWPGIGHFRSQSAKTFNVVQKMSHSCFFFECVRLP